MIKANEVRIGNLILVQAIDGMDARFARVVVIDKLNGFRVSSDIDDNYGMGCHFDIEPISLTPEILERCGFNFDEVQINIPGHDYEFVFDKEGIKYGYHGEEGFIMETQKPILFLHQLQNLYFALTGEELEIKDL